MSPYVPFLLGMCLLEFAHRFEPRVPIEIRVCGIRVGLRRVAFRSGGLRRVGVRGTGAESVGREARCVVYVFRTDLCRFRSSFRAVPASCLLAPVSGSRLFAVEAVRRKGHFGFSGLETMATSLTDEPDWGEFLSHDRHSFPPPGLYLSYL